MYKSSGSSFGGNLKDYPNWKQLLRSVIFPEYKRKVTIATTTWVNEDENASHYYVSFTIEADPLLVLEDDNEFKEVILWDHPREYKSYRLDWSEAIPYEEIAGNDAWEAMKLKFTDPQFALEFAQRIIREKFPEDTHEIIWKIDALNTDSD